MDHVSSLLPKILKKRGLYDHAMASLVVRKTDQWICEHLPGVSSALHARSLETGGRLCITADHAAALVAAHGQKDALLTFLHSAFPDLRIRDVSVRRA